MRSIDDSRYRKIESTHGLPTQRVAPIDSAEILRLSREVSIVDGRVEVKKTNIAVRQIQGVGAQQIAILFRQLPFGNQARCHFSPFALRFFRDGEELLYASICWDCNNIWITENGVHKYAEFDADAEVSQQLLRLIESIAGPA